MPLPNPKIAPCVVTPPVAGPDGTLTCPAPSEACQDPEYAADHPLECPNGSTITGLVVWPASGTIEVGAAFPFQARLTFADGTYKDVTQQAQWTSADPDTATVERGSARGVKEGSTTITGGYRGLTDSSGLTVVTPCVPPGMDIMLVIDRSGSMAFNEPNQQSRMYNAVLAAQAFVNSVDFSQHRVGVASFAGKVWQPASNVGDLLEERDTTLHLGLSSDRNAALTAILDVAGTLVNCDPNTFVGGAPPGYLPMCPCCTGIGGGFDEAGRELGNNARPLPVRQIVVLLSDGMENICDPDPDQVVTELRNNGVLIVCIAAAVPNAMADRCNGTKVPAHDYLRSLSSCNLFFAADSAADLGPVYATLPRALCVSIEAGGCAAYYFNPPPPPPPPAPGNFTGIVIEPDASDVPVGSRVPFRAYGLLNAGLGGGKVDITPDAGWSSDSANATVAGGEVTGVTVGPAIITATYETFTDTASANVIAACVTKPLDVILLLDRSTSMNNPSSLENRSSTRLDEAKRAMGAMISNMDFAKDRVGIVGFSGYSTTTGADAVRYADFSDDRDSLLNSVGNIPLNGINTGLGIGLNGAHELFQTKRPEAQGVVVMVTDGENNNCHISPVTAAAALKADKALIVVILAGATNKPLPPGQTCTPNSEMSWDYARGLSTCDLFFPMDSADQLPAFYALLPHSLCEGIESADPCFNP